MLGLVHLWLTLGSRVNHVRLAIDSSSAVLARHRTPESLLSSAELDRANRLKVPADRADFWAARLLTRELLARFLGAKLAGLELGQRCPQCQSPEHGRPIPVRGAHLSWSHSQGFVAAAVAGRPIGVDLEPRQRPRPEPAALASVLTASEQALVQASQQPDVDFYRIWTRKEALIKTGATSLDQLTEVDLSENPLQWHGIQLRTWTTPSTVTSLAITSAER